MYNFLKFLIFFFLLNVTINIGLVIFNNIKASYERMIILNYFKLLNIDVFLTTKEVFVKCLISRNLII